MCIDAYAGGCAALALGIYSEGLSAEACDESQSEEACDESQSEFARACG